MEDLEETLTLRRVVLRTLPVDYPQRFVCLDNLADTLDIRYNTLGNVEDLEGALALRREVLRLLPSHYPRRFVNFTNLAQTLNLRYQRLGRIEDLEETLGLRREVFHVLPAAYPLRFICLEELAHTLSARFTRLGQIEDLEETVVTCREALHLFPVDYPKHFVSIDTLADALGLRFQRLESVEDLEEALALRREALQLVPSDDPQWFIYLNNLADTVEIQFQRLGKTEDLEETLALRHKALNLLPANYPWLSTYLIDIAYTLQHRFARLGRIEDLEEAMRSYEIASTHDLASARSQLNASIAWVDGASKLSHPSLLRAYSRAISVLDQCIAMRPTIETQYEYLAEFRDIPPSLTSNACAAAISAGDPELAVEFLEHGRSIIWSKMIGYRQSLEQVRTLDANLAKSFERLSREIEQLSTVADQKPRTTSNQGLTEFLPSPEPSTDHALERHSALNRKLNQTISDIRNLPQLANFLQQSPFATLSEAAVCGPVILININTSRSDAIIVIHGVAPIVVQLSASLYSHRATLLNNLKKVRERSIGERERSQLLTMVLQDLWDMVVAPVVEALGLVGVREGKGVRIWWCPTSFLCGFPLHAAGPYRRGKKNLQDLYISSYTTTLSNLVRARSPPDQHTDRRMLLVGLTEAGASLPLVETELSGIQELSKVTLPTELLIGDDARRETVLDNMASCSWVHLACHGHQVLNAPFQSHFQLQGEESLTVLDIAKARLPNAELVFTSACHTAEGDANVPDEAVHLSASLQFCGFRGVVGTLWAMADEDGPEITKAFYAHMFRQPAVTHFTDAAVALNEATKELRKQKVPVPVHRWALFVHFGP